MSQYNSVNSFEVTECTLVSYINPVNIDIMNLWNSIEIYEDMYTNCLSGQIQITDSLNLLYHFGICGREKLIVSFSVPLLDGGTGRTKITRTFRVYKISERAPEAGDKTLRYILYFVSEEFIKSQQVKISKAYEGSIDTMVKSIYENYLRVDYTDAESQKLLDIDKTATEHRFIIPYWSPLSTINWLATRAVSATNTENCNFIFYEDLEGFKFKAFSNLCSNKEPVAEYEYTPVTRPSDGGEIQNKDLQQQYQTIQDFLMMEYHNTMKNIENGFFASQLLVHDIVRKKWNVTNYSYGKQFFDGQDHLHERPLVAPGNDDLSDKHLSNFKYYPKHLGLMGNNPTFKDNDRYEDWLLKRNSQMQQIEGCQLQLTLPGDSSLRIGNVINLKVPSFEVKENVYQDWLDKYMSGKYVVTAIRHSLVSTGDYTMKIEISRDSLPLALPDAKVFGLRTWPSQGDFFSQVVKA
jgi:hypothetical protein